MLYKKRTLGIFCAFSANIIFGFSFIFSKAALEVSHPLIILAVRFTVAFAFLNILRLFGVFKINGKAFKNPNIWLMGVAQPLLYFIFELYGLSLVSSALSGIIIALVPVAVMLLSGMVLKEKPNYLQWIFTAISIFGVSAFSIISNNGEKNYTKGIILLVCAVICSAIFNILSRKQSEITTPFERTYLMFLIGCVGFNAIAFCSLKNRFIPLLSESVTNLKFITAVIYLAIISSVLAFLLYNFATENITAVEASSFSNTITVVTVFAGVVILKEKISACGFLLCLIIILGVWGVNRFAENSHKKKF